MKRLAIVLLLLLSIGCSSQKVMSQKEYERKKEAHFKRQDVLIVISVGLLVGTYLVFTIND